LIEEQPCRIGIEALDPYIKVVAVEQNAQLGSLGRRLTIRWILLDEIRYRLNPLPSTFVKLSIDGDAIVRIYPNR